MTQHEHERLYRLERRLCWLEDRIRSNETKELTFDKAEASALRWAITFIERADKVLGGFSLTREDGDD